MVINKLVSLNKLKSLIDSLKQQKKIVVWTNGCFDILHVGHIKYLARAKMLGDVLIVGLNSDNSVKMLKGDERPLFNQKDRAIVLSAVVYVDYITIFNEVSPVKILRTIKPDFYVKGGDYTIETIDQQERKAVESAGGKIEIVPFIKGVSTTHIIEKLTTRPNAVI